MQYPVSMTIDEIAQLPGASDAFGDTDDLPETIRDYLSNGMSDMMRAYFAQHGFHYDEHGFTAQSRDSIVAADNFFRIVMTEYDGPRDESLHTHLGYRTPVWYLFGLGGDDDVDYCSSQPSCLTELLLNQD